MGLLDKFRKFKGLAEQSKQQENEQDKQEKDAFKPGDIVTGHPFKFTFKREDIIEYYGPHDDYERVVGHKIGWKVECVDKTTPMKDVVIPDTMLGYPVVDASECFKGCHNVASVAHIPTECLKFGDVKDMFAESGLRVIPEQLDSRLACLACGKAYAIPGVENLSKEHFYGREENIGEIMFATRRIAEFEEYKERDTLMMDEGLSKYQNFERVSFVYNFQPVSVVRVQDEDGTRYIALFNMKNEVQDIIFDANAYGVCMEGKNFGTELWTKENVAVENGVIKMSVAAHGAVMIRV